MLNDTVRQAIADRGLGTFTFVEEEAPQSQPDPVSPEAQKLFREARIYRERGKELDNQAAISHSWKRRMQLSREAAVSHDLADRYIEEGEAIAHYGRKGQKWGIRRTKKQLASADGKTVSTKKLKKQAKKMSNEELQANVKRLNLEKQYVSLTKEANAKTQSRMARGRKEMASIAKTSAKKALTSQTTNLMNEALSAGIKKARPGGST